MIKVPFRWGAQAKKTRKAIQSYEINIMKKNSHKSSRTFRIKIIFLEIFPNNFSLFCFAFHLNAQHRCTFTRNKLLWYWIIFCYFLSERKMKSFVWLFLRRRLVGWGKKFKLDGEWLKPSKFYDKHWVDAMIIIIV